jgi:hypothetical protein
MVDKYLEGIVTNVVAFRQVSRIARAELAGGDTEVAEESLIRLARDPKYSIDAAYEASVRGAYVQRDVVTRTHGLAERLATLKAGRGLSRSVRAALTELRDEIDRLIGR